MDAAIPSFLEEKRIAVVGVSRTRGFGNAVLKTLRARGWDAVPVNANADTVEGERCFRALAAIPERPGAVVAVVPPGQAERVVEDCLALGIRKLWLQQGAESEAAIRRAEAGGMTVVHHACVLMHAQPHGIHRLHRWLARRSGRADTTRSPRA
jgi:predicted CoA-binding protein